MAGLWAEVLTRNFMNMMEEYYPLSHDVRAVFNFKIKTIFLCLLKIKLYSEDTEFERKR
jgi:hypothetical protein